MADYRSIFTRALGLNTLLGSAPERRSLSDEFIRNYYYRYADQLFQSHNRQSQVTYSSIEDLGFEDSRSSPFRRYSKMLEQRVGRELILPKIIDQ